MVTRDIIVVGASAGGLAPLRQILSQLPEDLPASLFVVLHLPATRPQPRLTALLAQSGPLPVRWAEDGEPVDQRGVRLAPPNRHLLLSRGRSLVRFGPRECNARPSVDVLFRSAAVNLRSRVTGVVLSGQLDDGARGLAAVRRCGGAAIVMDPAEAVESEMPRSALRSTSVDHCVPAEAIAPLLVQMASEPISEEPNVPDDLKAESRITEQTMVAEGVPTWDDPALLSCPDCGGPLQALGEDQNRSYRCRLGHAYGTDSLLAVQQRQLEQALWVAMRTVSDRMRVLDRLADDFRTKERFGLADDMAERSRELDQHYRIIRDVLAALCRPEAPPSNEEPVQAARSPALDEPG